MTEQPKKAVRRTGEKQDWKLVLAELRTKHREVIERHWDSCPECGLCNPEWKAQCTKDWCPHKNQKA